MKTIACPACGEALSNHADPYEFQGVTVIPCDQVPVGWSIPIEPTQSTHDHAKD